MTGVPDNESPDPGMERAEEMLDQMTQAVQEYATQAGVWVMKYLARGREELEDIWAEAQSLGHGDQG